MQHENTLLIGYTRDTSVTIIRQSRLLLSLIVAVVIVYLPRAGNRRKNNVRTGRAGVWKITNVALTLVVSGSRERSKLYRASRRMVRARRERDGLIVARSSPDYQLFYVQPPSTGRSIFPIVLFAIDTGQKRCAVYDDYDQVIYADGLPFCDFSRLKQNCRDIWKDTFKLCTKEIWMTISEIIISLINSLVNMIKERNGNVVYDLFWEKV